MSKIKVFSLGGLNEMGKNMYIVDVDNDIFVFDAGLKYADDSMLGVDYVIFGHTHQMMVEKINGITYLNPGSLGYEKTYIEIFNKTIRRRNLNNDWKTSFRRSIKVLFNRSK